MVLLLPCLQSVSGCEGRSYRKIKHKDLVQILISVFFNNATGYCIWLVEYQGNSLLYDYCILFKNKMQSKSIPLHRYRINWYELSHEKWKWPWLVKCSIRKYLQSKWACGQSWGFLCRMMPIAQVETIHVCLHFAGLYMRKRSNSSCWIGACSVEL